MEIDVIVQLITTIGFPIVMCLLMWKQLQDSNKQHSEDLAKVEEALNNNTLVVQQLIDKLDK